ncbi:hypothetical protein [Tenggerimyces flavus]|uniref:Uncharacterized protein n=1 Tax=Tenggerimyces flavus TaxID=1708749 RepID=A0ABV7YAX6_9ACTN|nr:hypothetical protein [Tenggerimyces flavus]MBM7786578.1 hypothetical protein [Tenggerimyces flavus]
MSDLPRGGPLSEDPEFRVVSEPESYADTTAGPIRYTTVYVSDQPVAYVWAATDDTAAGVLYRQSALDTGGGNASVGWWGRLDWAFANRLTPSEVLRHWAGKPLDPDDERCGVVRADEEHELATLAELEELAVEDGPAAPS